MVLKKVLLIAVVFSIGPAAWAQLDSTYVKPFGFRNSARIYTSKNTFSLEFENINGLDQQFLPNNPASIGLGFSWKNSSLSFGYGFSFLREKKKGKTHAIDFQYHHYGKKWIVDLYFLSNRSFFEQHKEEILFYPDLQLKLYGGFFQYVFNDKRFSFGAAFDQNARQLKSAGSLLVGGSAYYSEVENQPLIGDFSESQDKKLWLVGPNLGYAYTWVALPRLYLSATLSVGVNASLEQTSLRDKDLLRVNPLLFSRFTVGYNADDWTLNFSMINNRVYINYKEDFQSSLTTGNLTLTLVKRFDLKRDFSLLKYDLKFPTWKDFN